MHYYVVLQWMWYTAEKKSSVQMKLLSCRCKMHYIFCHGPAIIVCLFMYRFNLPVITVRYLHHTPVYTISQPNISVGTDSDDILVIKLVWYVPTTTRWVVYSENGDNGLV